ncbi:MAG TPA: single-stranded-DNA-specific exonuclease RecJ [Gammaproteobacteria bacterium]|nr:single-stranded-DNA-specific exonuclease RecJ [Gammaproteobacteria bacterium]HCY03881.1 single-stranded-DNA-specific exonuclease RecJ [Gammaproteobacteria bacterium]
MQIITRAVGEGALGVDNPLIERLYLSRGLTHADETEKSLASLLSPLGLIDIEKAAERIADAVVEQQSILIIGDYDADGATSVALSKLALAAMGAGVVEFLVPDRFQFGYGLSVAIVAVAERLKPDLIITVDNGISSLDGVAAANAAGIDVIVSDHHLPGAELPAAYAIVNPNRGDCGFSSKSMAGVGVAYYLLSWVRHTLRQRQWFNSSQRPEPNLGQFLDLVALGTVADVVPLDCNNRILVHQGLLRMRQGHTRPGIRALVEIGKRDLSRLSAQDLGFAVGPRLNAAGRLQDMSVGIRCLLADDLSSARALAQELDGLNKDRRELEQDMVADAELLLAQVPKIDRNFGVAVYHERFHQGVVGIVAGRLRERLHRPAIVFADSSEGAAGEIKGSARSIDGLNIRDVLDTIATRYPGLLIKFGGHAMAAGLSLKHVHFERFRSIFDGVVSELIDEDTLRAKCFVDGGLTEQELTLETVHTLFAAGPWGSGFPEPTFCDDFELVSQRVVGAQHLKLVLRKETRLVDAIAFRQPPLDQRIKRLRVVYRPARNDYGNTPTLQLIVEYVEPLA